MLATLINTSESAATVQVPVERGWLAYEPLVNVWWAILPAAGSQPACHTPG
jgi:hypothetical protein